MLIKTTMALAVILGTASGALAATKTHSTNPAHDVYDSLSRYVGSDPDPAIRFELRRDWAYGPRN